MNKILIIIIGIVAVIALLGYSATMMHFPYPERDLGEITYIDSPDSYSSSSSLTLKIQIENSFYTVVTYCWRILDADFIGPIHPDTGWVGKLAVSGLNTSQIFYLPFDVPGCSGLGNDFKGVIEIGHYTSFTSDAVWLDDRMSFTVQYTSDSDPPPTNDPPTTGQINGPSTAQVGDPANFYCNVYDNDGDSIQTRWDFGDGITTSWTSVGSVSSVTHTYTTSGTYSVKAQPRDNHGTGLWSSSKTITITGSTPNNLDITIGVKDSSTNNYLSDATVTINSEDKTTTSTGKTLFTLPIGAYNVEVSKDGYNSYSEIHSFSSDTEITIELTLEGSFTPGFELLTLIGAIGIAFLIFKKRGKICYVDYL